MVRGKGARMMLTLCIIYAAYSTRMNLVMGLPNGAPSGACADLLPVHPGGSTQASYPPFQVQVAPGHQRVLLTLGSADGLPFEGFIIVPRDVETGEFVGEFAILPNLTKSLECTTGIKVRTFYIDT